MLILYEFQFREACCRLCKVFRVPTSTGKPGKMRQLFPGRESRGILKKCRKVRENCDLQIKI